MSKQDKKLASFPIRFKQDDDTNFPDWQERRLGEIFDITAGGDIDQKDTNPTQTSKYKYPVYANSEKDNGLHSWASTYKQNENCITVTGRGTLGKAIVRYEKFYPIIRLLVLRSQSNISLKFFAEAINLLKIHNESTGVPQLTVPQISAYNIKYPSLLEQQKIASFLESVDTKIQLLERKVVLLQSYKKGVMQKLFSQELRFKDEQGHEYPDWEERRLGEILEYEQPTKYIVDSSKYNDNYSIPVLTAGKTFILGYTNETYGVFTNHPVIIFDDFTTVSKFVDFDFKVKSSAMKILKLRKNIQANIKLVYECMQKINFSLKGHKRYWISEYQHIAIPFPTLLEQQKIGSFLQSLDTKISLTQKQVTLTKLYKKGLLQRMFA